MPNRTGLCPTCGVIGTWRFSGVRLSFPPTGGDYTWAETDATAHCPACSAPIAVRVRVDLDDGQVDRLMHSPVPTLHNRRWYVAARVRNHAADLVSVTVIAFAEAADTAQAELQRIGGAYHSSYEERCVLVLSAAGFQSLDGTSLHPSANKVIQYD
jgi:hypothetical protein